MFKITCMKCGSESVVTPYVEDWKDGRFWFCYNTIGSVFVDEEGGCLHEGISFNCESCGNFLSDRGEVFRIVDGKIVWGN